MKRGDEVSSVQNDAALSVQVTSLKPRRKSVAELGICQTLILFGLLRLFWFIRTWWVHILGSIVCISHACEHCSKEEEQSFNLCLIGECVTFGDSQQNVPAWIPSAAERLLCLCSAFQLKMLESPCHNWETFGEYRKSQNFRLVWTYPPHKTSSMQWEDWLLRRSYNTKQVAHQDRLYKSECCVSTSDPAGSLWDEYCEGWLEFLHFEIVAVFRFITGNVRIQYLSFIWNTSVICNKLNKGAWKFIRVLGMI